MFNGLPLHILLVHVVVIVLPAAALLTVLGAVWPAFRRKLGVITPVVALIGLISVPLATNAGEWLEERLNSTPLIQAHVALGDTLLPWAVGQFVVATAIWVWYRWFAAVRTVPGAPQRHVAAPGDAVRSAATAHATAAATPGRAAAGGSVPAGFQNPGIAGTDGPLAADGSVLLHGDDPFAPAAGTQPATPGIRPTAPPRSRAGRTASLAVSIAAIVVALVVSTGTVVKVVQIGESGSNAVWQGSFSPDPVEG
ncbi:hypothetical protein B7R54_15970 [Subtercola boreus]|uniref:Uncharacterized protein n=1 Tax=Subtercola boreus TaxID=120213 RepID=A0A3E0VLL3_9MICO|nr:DUF2231 domain-containing protein [Subtercola boreus]RFA10535.1 hypothetical protein B7R54_15970 [Subtercola boreus]TQL55926.1 hypothetical protein FB464_3500 [Subtercola boreus]